jgi:Family of unknown function (DUF5335)
MKRMTKTRSFSRGTQPAGPRSKRQTIATARTKSGRSRATAQRGKAQSSGGTREIPRNQWVQFFDAFSKNHDGWLTRVEVTPARRAKAEEARDLPLQGITADLQGSSSGTTFIILDMRPNVHLTHSVPRTKKVIFDEGRNQLKISSASGDSATVNFKPPRKAGR